MSAIPVVICGKTEQIATSVIAGLQPEYEVIHMIMNPTAGAAQLPLLLSGQPAPSDTALGTHNYAQPPAAILVGAGYAEEEIEQMRSAVEAAPGVKQVPWLVADRAPGISASMPPPGPEYGKVIVQRIKTKLVEMTEGDKIVGEGLVRF